MTLSSAPLVFTAGTELFSVPACAIFFLFFTVSERCDLSYKSGHFFVFNTLVLRADQRISSELTFCFLKWVSLGYLFWPDFLRYRVSCHKTTLCGEGQAGRAGRHVCFSEVQVLAWGWQVPRQSSPWWSESALGAFGWQSSKNDSKQKKKDATSATRWPSIWVWLVPIL